MTVLSAVQSACSVVGLEIPTIIYGSQEREHIELSHLANYAAYKILKSCEWQVLQRVHTIIGDGILNSFPLPYDYDRMMKCSELRKAESPNSTLLPVLDLDTWQKKNIGGSNYSRGEWIIYGNNISIRPTLSINCAISYPYISSHIISGNKTAFTSDEDTLLVDENLLKLFMIWQWKANKGQQYAEDLKNYEDALSIVISSDKGHKKLSLSTTKMM